jgi:AraC family transcriptional regulator of adaptative response/methylated-DNA-[protein]-cysteine methyltransferase
MVRFSTGLCSLGVLLVACSDQGICAVFVGDVVTALEQALAKRFPGAARDDASLLELVPRVLRVVDGIDAADGLLLDLRGTPFQRRVWGAMATIPRGTTRTYGELARSIGAPNAVRAVARACGENPVAILVPCHRVLGAKGALTGYRWGIDTKRALLEREGASFKA